PEPPWVRDDLRARAMAVSDLRGRGDIVVVVAVDLYMVFRNDAEAIRRAVAERLPPRLADRTTGLVRAPSAAPWPAPSPPASPTARRCWCRPRTTTTGPTPRSTSTTTGTSRWPVGSRTGRPRAGSPRRARGLA